MDVFVRLLSCWYVLMLKAKWLAELRAVRQLTNVMVLALYVAAEVEARPRVSMTKTAFKTSRAVE